MGRQAPKTRIPGTEVDAAASSGGFDPNKASVSYITSFLPGATTPTQMTEAQLNRELITMTPQERIAYANRLKEAGYRVGPITGAVTKDLRSSWLTAHSDLTAEVQAGQALDLNTFLAANRGTGTGGTGGPKTITQTYEINDTSAAALINKIFQDATGYGATPQEIAKYTADLRKAQAAAPTRVTYTAAGSSATKGGIDTTEYLTEKIGQTGAAQTGRATDAYAIMMEELGGLR